MNAPHIPPTHGIQPEIAVAAIPADERVWVPQAKDVWFRPLLLNTVTGGWCNLLRVRKSGVLSRHRHPMVVVGYVISAEVVKRVFYRLVPSTGSSYDARVTDG